jgi:hypothetical protein
MSTRKRFERGFDIKHWIVLARTPKIAIWIWTAFGGGLTLLSYEKWVWLKDDGWQGRIAEEDEMQRGFERSVNAAPFLRSLQIRSWGTYDLRFLEGKKHLKWLQVASSLAGPLDFSRLTKLEILAGSDNSIQKISGLSQLPRLMCVYVTGLKKTWLDQLPESVEIMYVTAKLPAKATFAHLPKLRKLGLNSNREIDFSKLPVIRSLEELDLTNIKEMINHSEIRIAFPNLRKLNVGSIRESDYNELVAVLKDCDIDLWDGFILPKA